MKKQKSYLFEILIGGFLLCVMIGVRFSYIYDYITAAYGDRRFLELALIRQDAGIPYFSSTLAGIYTGGLRLLFWFVGNKEMMAVYAQAVLQILTLSFFFLALERMCGVLLSAIVLLAVLFLDKGLWLMGELTPGNLLLLLGSVYFLFLAVAIKRAEKKKSRFFFVCGFFWTGAVCGMLAALDSYGLVLLALSFFFIVLSRKLPVGFLLGAAAGMNGVFFAKSCLYGLSFTAPYREYYNSYFYAENWNPFVRFGTSSMALNFLLLLFLAGGLFFFIRRSVAAKKLSGTAQESRIPDISVTDIESLPVPKLRTVVSEETKESGQTDESDKAGSKRRVQYIENPLPVPKKHVKKEMTYAFEPDEAHMCYDLKDIPQDSDYDIE